MKIRLLKKDDLTALGELYEQFWGEKSSLERMRKTFQKLSKDSNYIFLWVQA